MRKNRTGSGALLSEKLCVFEFGQCKAPVWISNSFKGLLCSLPFFSRMQNVDSLFVFLEFQQSAEDFTEILDSTLDCKCH